MDLKLIESTVSVGVGVDVTAEEVELGRNVRIADGVKLRTSRLRLGDDVRIDRDVTVDAESFDVGAGTCIETRCQLGGMGGRAQLIRLGEQTLVAHDTKILVPVAVLGDYVAIHNHGLLNGRRTLVIGHNAWIGQHCMLNSEDELTIGNNVGIGAYSTVYTHGYFGDLLEGCGIFKVAPVVLEDDVWILGSHNIVSPGVTIGAKALVLTGSNVTKNVPANHTVGGSPARDMTDRLVPYRTVPPAEKLEMIQRFVKEFLDLRYAGAHEPVAAGYSVRAPYGPFRIRFLETLDSAAAVRTEGEALLAFTPTSELVTAPPLVTIFDLVRRQYTRTRSKAEIEMMRFLRSYRARFVPADEPRVRAPAA